MNINGNRILVGIVTAFVSSMSFAGPGYVSRDCAAVTTKESISMAWTGPNEFFFTFSTHYRVANNANGYVSETIKASNDWQLTWRNRAGRVYYSAYNNYYMGVYGVHYWYNQQFNRIEQRRIFVTTCYLESWGYNNW